MATTKPATKATKATKAAKATKAPAKRSARRATGKGGASSGFTAEERAAMKERARELKAARGGRVDGEREVLARIASMVEPDRTLAERLHALVKDVAPDLEPRTWYGMPAYARDGGVVCFFQERAKFKARYAVLGFTDKARLDDGAMWPNSYAIEALTPAVEATIVALLAKAVS